MFISKERYGPDTQLPSFISFIALASGFVFMLTLLTVFMRIFTKRSLPAEYQDPPSIVSMNECIKNTLIYVSIFMGLHFYLSKSMTE